MSQLSGKLYVSLYGGNVRYVLIIYYRVNSLRDAFKNEKVHKERIPSLHNLPPPRLDRRINWWTPICPCPWYNQVNYPPGTSKPPFVSWICDHNCVLHQDVDHSGGLPPDVTTDHLDVSSQCWPLEEELSCLVRYHL